MGAVVIYVALRPLSQPSRPEACRGLVQPVIYSMEVRMDLVASRLSNIADALMKACVKAVGRVCSRHYCLFLRGRRVGSVFGLRVVNGWCLFCILMAT